MKITPKILLGVAGTVLIISLLIFSGTRTPHKNFLTITAGANRFKINFQIDPKNQIDLERTLALLSILPTAKDGVEFELDPTNSAKLAFLVPVNSSINFAPQKVSLEGTIDNGPYKDIIQPEPIKVPIDTIFTVFSSNLSTFLRKQFQGSPEAQKLFDNILGNQKGHYLVTTSKDFAFYFKNDNLNVDDLETTDTESSNQKINLLKPTSLLLFRTDSYNVITTSYEIVNQLTSNQNSQTINPDLARLSGNKPASLIVLFKNPGRNLAKEDLSPFVKINPSKTLNESKVIDALNNIEEASFALKQDRFSALIKFK